MNSQTFLLSVPLSIDLFKLNSQGLELGYEAQILNLHNLLYRPWNRLKMYKTVQKLKLDFPEDICISF